MKILFLSDDFPPASFGGAGIIAFRDAIALMKRGHQVSAITTTVKQQEVGKSFYEGLEVHKIYSNCPERWHAYTTLNNRSVVKEISRTIDDTKPDVIHVHNIHARISYASLKAAKLSGAKVFLTLHDAMSVAYGKLFPSDDGAHNISHKISSLKQWRQNKLSYNPYRNIRIRYYLRYADHIFVVSDALRRALEENGITGLTTLHNGIDAWEWTVGSADSESFRRRYNLVGRKVVLFGGRLSGAKGCRAALKALKALSTSVSSAVMLVVGSDSSQAALRMKKHAESLDINTKVIFAGWLDGASMKSATAAADLVIVPSVYLDPFPTVNLEAMACGKPVVGTKFGGTPEAVIDGETGYIIDPRDIGSFSAKMADLLNDEKKAEQFGRAGRERVIKEFSLDKHTCRLLKWYNA
jgi:glycosyltransferase involved in cell wall biosynthesis